MRRVLVPSVLLGLSLLCGCKHRDKGTAPSSGSPAHTSTDAASAARIQADLLNVGAPQSDTDVPAGAQELLPSFKDALVQLTDDLLAAQPGSANAAQVQQALKAGIPAGKMPPAAASSPNPDDFTTPIKGAYGGELAATASQPLPGYLLVDEAFDVQCGDDHILLVYSNGGGNWRRILRWQAAPYKQVSAAFGDGVETRLLQPSRNGHPVLLVTHGTPWCSSTESGFSMDTFELNPTGATDKPFWHGEHQYRRADEMFTLKPTQDGFEIRTSTDDHIGEAISRTGILRYALVGGNMQRTLPIGMNARESVSEWIGMPRDEAKLFTDAAPGSATWRMWDTLTFRNKSEDEAMKVPMLSYGDVRACDDAKRYQVEVKTEVYSADNKSHAPGGNYYVQVRETGNGYRLLDTSSQPFTACRGRVVVSAPH